MFPLGGQRTTISPTISGKLQINIITKCIFPFAEEWALEQSSYRCLGAWSPSKNVVEQPTGVFFALKPM